MGINVTLLELLWDIYNKGLHLQSSSLPYKLVTLEKGAFEWFFFTMFFVFRLFQDFYSVSKGKRMWETERKLLLSIGRQ